MSSFSSGNKMQSLNFSHGFITTDLGVEWILNEDPQDQNVLQSVFVYKLGHVSISSCNIPSCVDKNIYVETRYFKLRRKINCS